MTGRAAIGRLAAAATLLALAACATGPGRGGDSGPVMGAAARHQHGADPMAAPPPGAGEAEDPASATPR